MPTNAGPWGRAAAHMALAALSVIVVLSSTGCASKREDAKPTPLAEFKPALSVRVAWSRSIGSARGLPLQPAAVENAIYVAAANGTLARLAPDTGRTVWRIDVGHPIVAGVGSDGFTVAVVTRKGELLAFDADGKLRWRATLTSDGITPPLVGRGVVVVRTSDQRVGAFAADDGKRRWLFQRQQPALTLRAPTELAFAGDNVVVGFPAGRMLAIGLANGAARWELAVSEPRGTTEVERLADVVGPVAVAGADVCAASFQGRVSCAEAGNGTLRWTRELSAGNGVAIDAAQVYSVDVSSHVLAFRRDAGASQWRNHTLAQRKLTAPLALPSAVVVGDLEGHVHFLAPSDGQLLARVRVDRSAVVVTPRAWAAGAVVATQDGTIALLAVDR
jgi:outer membrane protein assembly factor BamB